MAHILCLGMAALDHVFRVDSFPDSGVKLRADGYEFQVGGPAALAAASIARLGGVSSLCTRLGRDANSKTIISELETAGVDWSFSVVSPRAAAPVSSVYVDADGERQIVNYRGRGLSASPPALGAADLKDVDAVLVDPRWPQGAAYLAALARDRGIPAVVDAENELDALHAAMANASHIAFSANGLRQFSGKQDIEEGLRYCARHFAAWLCVTEGAKGTTCLEGGEITHVDAFPVDASDTLGAGDVWHGAFALGLGEGRSTSQAVRFANAAAAIKCRNGSGRSALPGREETLELLNAAGPAHRERTA